MGIAVLSRGTTSSYGIELDGLTLQLVVADARLQRLVDARREEAEQHVKEPNAKAVPLHTDRVTRARLLDRCFGGVCASGAHCDAASDPSPANVVTELQRLHRPRPDHADVIGQLGGVRWCSNRIYVEIRRSLCSSGDLKTCSTRVRYT